MESGSMLGTSWGLVFSLAPLLVLDYWWSHNLLIYWGTVTPNWYWTQIFRDLASTVARWQVHIILLLNYCKSQIKIMEIIMRKTWPWPLLNHVFTENRIILKIPRLVNFTAWKASVLGVILVRIFLHSN